MSSVCAIGEGGAPTGADTAVPSSPDGADGWSLCVTVASATNGTGAGVVGANVVGSGGGAPRGGVLSWLPSTQLVH